MDPEEEEYSVFSFCLADRIVSRPSRYLLKLQTLSQAA